MKKIFEIISKPINGFYHAFNNGDEGASMRKILAFGAFLLVVRINYSWTNFDNALSMKIADYVFCAVCLGLVTAQQLIEWKNGIDNKSKDKTPKIAYEEGVK